MKTLWQCQDRDGRTIYQVSFFNRFFGDDGKDEIPEAMQLLPVRNREAELEYIWILSWKDPYGKQTGEMQFPENIIKVLKHIRGSSENSTNKTRIQVRRLLYFLLLPHDQGVNQYLSEFLQSPMLLTYLKHVEENKPFTRSQEDRHLRFLLQVLQECFAGGCWRMSIGPGSIYNPETSGV